MFQQESGESMFAVSCWGPAGERVTRVQASDRADAKGETHGEASSGESDGSASTGCRPSAEAGARNDGPGAGTPVGGQRSGC